MPKNNLPVLTALLSLLKYFVDLITPDGLMKLFFFFVIPQKIGCNTLN